jgi:hypothetical protein
MVMLTTFCDVLSNAPWMWDDLVMSVSEVISTILIEVGERPQTLDAYNNTMEASSILVTFLLLGMFFNFSKEYVVWTGAIFLVVGPLNGVTWLVVVWTICIVTYDFICLKEVWNE